MDDDLALRAVEERVFQALRARDGEALARELDAGFVHSSPGSPDQDREAFLQGVREMPFRILEIGAEDLAVRVLGDVALVSGVQRARVALEDGQTADAATAFVDLFVRRGGGWRLQHAVSFELPATAG